MPKIWTVYCTQNLVNDKFYYGVHKTANPDDAYLGSGKYLRASIAKYGEKNFLKIVLLVTRSKEKAYNLERRLVAKQFGHLNCMNLKHGGEGGFDYIVTNGLNVPNARLGSIEAHRRFIEDKQYRAKVVAHLAKVRFQPTPEITQKGLAKLAQLRSTDPEWEKKNWTKARRRKQALAMRGNKHALGKFRAKPKPPKKPRTSNKEVHGTCSCYRHGCRCRLCIDVYRTYHREDMRKRKILHH